MLCKPKFYQYMSLFHLLLLPFISRKKTPTGPQKNRSAPYGPYVAHSHKIIETEIINRYNK